MEISFFQLFSKGVPGQPIGRRASMRFQSAACKVFHFFTGCA